MSRQTLSLAFQSSILLLSLLVAGALPVSAESLFDHLDPEWVQQPAWYQGDAEINLYDAQVVIYGEPRQAEELAHIIVTEDHRPDQLVKADDHRAADNVPMLKLNYVTEARTGVYSYRQMLSFFFTRADMRVAKMTLAHHEWCGNTFKELVHFGDRSTYTFNTYWDGQGSGAFDVEFPADLVIYDALPVQLRALRFRQGLSVKFPLLGRQLSSKARQPTWPEATLTVVEKSRVSVPAGATEAWILRLEHAGGTDQLWFEADFPNRMLAWMRADGDRFRLSKSQRLAYWALAAPGDEEKLQ
ncbi:MAG: hypothetical protein AAGE94_10430 [Acidobacteriota bacterium]